MPVEINSCHVCGNDDVLRDLVAKLQTLDPPEHWEPGTDPRPLLEWLTWRTTCKARDGAPEDCPPGCSHAEPKLTR